MMFYAQFTVFDSCIFFLCFIFFFVHCITCNFFFLKDEKLQNVLGHFQKDFEGGVSAENLGKSRSSRTMSLSLSLSLSLVKLEGNIIWELYHCGRGKIWRVWLISTYLSAISGLVSSKDFSKSSELQLSQISQQFTIGGRFLSR